MATQFESDLTLATPFGFGNNATTVEDSLNDSGVNNITYTNWTRAGDWALVDPGGGADRYYRLRADPNDRNFLSWTAIVPQRNEYWMTFSFYFESTGGSGLASDQGYDFGDSDSDAGGTRARTSLTGGKMPGMMKGSPGDNTGGNIDGTVWSGRHMWRGYNSGGNGGSTRDGIAMSYYPYFEQENGQNRGIQQTYWFEGDHSGSQVEFGTNGSGGTGRGQYGDTKAQLLDTDCWYHLVAGYFVPDGANGFYRSWMCKDGDNAWTPMLEVDNMRYMDPGNQGIDGWHFSQLWGGNTADWEPNRTAYTRYKHFGLYTTEQEALDARLIHDDEPVILSPDNFSGTVGGPVTGNTAANDLNMGDAPTICSLIAGGLPPGAAWNPSTGALSGTYTAAGSFSATYQCVDSNGDSASTTMSFVVAEDPTAGSVRFVVM